MEYNNKIKDVLFFLQEKVLQHSDHTKKSAVYMSLSAGIDSYVDRAYMTSKLRFFLFC